MPIINKDTPGGTVITPATGKTTLFTDSGLAYLKQDSGTIVPLGGSVSNVSVVTANGVSGSVANPTTTPAITLTLGNITPSSVTNSGNLTFTGVSNLIGGDFSNATTSSRVLLQTTTVNGLTSIGVVPNGTASNSALTLYSSSNSLNASVAQLSINNTTADLSSGITGSGTYRPLQILTGGTVRATMTTGGLLGLGIVPATVDLEIGKGAATNILQRSSSATASASGALTLYRSRGTNASPTAISSGDTIGVVSFGGYGTSYQNSANITVTATETFSGTVGGTALAINTITHGGVVSSQKLRIDGTGNIQLQGAGADISNVDSLNGGQLAGFRNRIINGQMLIDQRYGGVAQTPVADSYTLDRWKLQISQASKLTVQTVLDAPVGFYASTLLTVASTFTPAATDYFIYRQYIEANNTTDFKMGTAGAKSIAVSFWVKGSVAGTYSGVIINSGSPRAYPFNYTVTTGWAKQTIIIPGDTAGSWVTGGNGVGMNLLFDLGSGTNYQGTANAWSGTTLHGVTGATKFVSQTAGATLNITGVQLEIGTVSTEFEQRLFSTELALCQRYMEIINNDVLGYAAAGTNIGARTKFAVNKRAVPTVSQISNNISFTQTNVTTTTCTYIANSSEGFVHYRVCTASGPAQYSESAVARAEY